MVAILALIVAGCSDQDAGAGTVEAPSCAEGGTPLPAGDPCVPHLSKCWTPTWRPPKTDLAACTPAQVEADKAKCWGSDYDPDCAAFQRDPANLRCLNCLFTTEDERSLGALILLGNGSAVANISGCMAIVDGDTSATGCAVKYQEYEQCIDAACRGCQAFESYTSCTRAAALDCRLQLQAAGCRSKPIYSVCRSYSTFDEYFFAMAQIFCMSGVDGGTTLDAGATPADGGESGAPEHEGGAEDAR